MGVTIATHNGSQVALRHNRRDENVVSKEEHINPNGEYEIWKDESPQQAYDKLFGEALKEYNAKQTREDRKIDSYYQHIKKDKKKHTVYEMIIGIYGKDEEGNAICSKETGKEIMKKFVESWQKRNSHLYMCGAYYHADEEGEPHVHIDYIPYSDGYKKGMSVQNGLVKALEQEGFFLMNRKNTAQILWEKRENGVLETLCKEHNLIVEHPLQETREHLSTEVYKAKKRIEEANIREAQIKALESEIEEKNREANKLLANQKSCILVAAQEKAQELAQKKAISWINKVYPQGYDTRLVQRMVEHMKETKLANNLTVYDTFAKKELSLLQKLEQNYNSIENER